MFSVSYTDAAARLTGKLIGLARATDGNEHLINPDASAVIIQSLAATSSHSSPDDALLEQLCARVEEEKRKMVPGCFTCACPCGKNADYDLQDLLHDSEEIRNLKLQLLDAIRNLASTLSRQDEEAERFLYTALIVIGMDGWNTERLLPIVSEADQIRQKCPRLPEK